jgi:hypothetical protein
MKPLFTAALFLLSISAFAQDVFVIKKSMNPKNVLHYKVNIKDCKIQSPAITPYWTMGEDDGHVEALTSKEKSYFAPKNVYEKSSDADFSFGALEKMGDKISDQSISIRLENCKPKAFMEMNGREIQLTEIYVSVSMLMSVKYMEITGLTSNGARLKTKINN